MRLAISAGLSPPTLGPGKCGPSSTSKSTAGIWISTPRLTIPARPVRAARVRVLSKRENQLRLHEKNHRGHRILWLRRPGHGLFAHVRATAPDFSGHRPESLAQMGSELRSGSRRDALHGSSYFKDDSWVSFRLLIGISPSLCIGLSCPSGTCRLLVAANPAAPPECVHITPCQEWFFTR